MKAAKDKPPPAQARAQASSGGGGTVAERIASMKADKQKQQAVVPTSPKSSGGDSKTRGSVADRIAAMKRRSLDQQPAKAVPSPSSSKGTSIAERIAKMKESGGEVKVGVPSYATNRSSVASSLTSRESGESGVGVMSPTTPPAARKRSKEVLELPPHIKDLQVGPRESRKQTSSEVPVSYFPFSLDAVRPEQHLRGLRERERPEHRDDRPQLRPHRPGEVRDSRQR